MENLCTRVGGSTTCCEWVSNSTSDPSWQATARRSPPATKTRPVTPLGWVRVGPDEATRGDLPEPHGPVLRARGQPGPARMEGDSPDSVGVAGQFPNQAGRPGVPEPHDLVETACGQQFAIGTVRHV